MTAYVVFIRESTQDPDELATYNATVKPSFEGHPIAFHALYGDYEVLEGPPVEGVVIVSFPTMDEARAWYHSPAYQAVAQHRFKGATYRSILVQGVD
ncbi:MULTISPECIES: DUF1330 domain-containing protein [unclassified Luteibacter]|uniref:DUF1330 domain-containing protein n=1 Tax=unclassified Luteibacter TaxID=2620188 RepID=UPI0008BC02A9|nr:MULTISPECIES: DUF1330 domain-containing protein [unclassified Luteibacter]MDR6935461.1 uncharacterized protein (DUF1330 family) [Luteibacter sp. 3190]SEV95088.1 Uncharacterized conserved protein, DUF1330 family [Luteibacter sp. 329MFSha]